MDAILGGKNILQQSHATCAICSYHRKNDEEYLRYLLEGYGYDTETSTGYMLFLWDPSIYDSADFRRGIVYAKK